VANDVIDHVRNNLAQQANANLGMLFDNRQGDPIPSTGSTMSRMTPTLTPTVAMTNYTIPMTLTVTVIMMMTPSLIQTMLSL
jgi:hypothetical protein